MHHYITMDTTVTVIINVRKKHNVCFIFSEVNVLVGYVFSEVNVLVGYVFSEVNVLVG
ncbi:hypothetical protein AGOR_G00253040 [Albula goreensis]|uniref:Uncharacterized protein n=1 Tax=Albula goreensis TaxID=1534307 RepID=A0A8T3CEW7_9TELE|nr:hypothetical protein AGOR_G00253040 [Albula goreensis]